MTDNTKRDTVDNHYLIEGIGEFALSFVPVVSNVLSAFSSYHNKKALDFVKEVLLDVQTKIERLEQKLDKEYMATEDYMNFVHKTLLKAANDLRQEKLHLFSNIIVNSALKANSGVESGRKYLYDDTIDKIDEGLFCFLLKISERGLNGMGLESKGWTGNDEELKLLNVDDKTFQFNSEYLLGIGTMIRLPKFELEENTGVLKYHEEYFITQYGKEFVDFVKEQVA